MNDHRHGNVLDVCTLRPRFVLRRRSSRSEVQDDCHADPYCPGFIASWRSQLGGWQCTRHELRRTPPALSGQRPRSRLLSRAAVGPRDLAQSQAAEHRPDRRLRSPDNVRLAQLTAGKERMTCATINYTRPHRGTVTTIQSLQRGWYLASERKDPNRSNSRFFSGATQMCIRRSSIGCNEL
jgi:hypothetical protein